MRIWRSKTNEYLRIFVVVAKVAAAAPVPVAAQVAVRLQRPIQRLDTTFPTRVIVQLINFVLK